MRIFGIKPCVKVNFCKDLGSWLGLAKTLASPALSVKSLFTGGVILKRNSKIGKCTKSAAVRPKFKLSNTISIYRK